MNKKNKVLCCIVLVSFMVIMLPIVNMHVIASENKENDKISVQSSSSYRSDEPFYLQQSTYRGSIKYNETTELEVTPIFNNGSSETLSYEWYKSENYNDFEKIPDANINTLVVTCPQSEMRYKVVASNSTGFSASSMFYVGREPVIELSTLLTDISTSFGKTVTLIVNVKCLDPNVTISSYEWYKYEGNDSIKIDGANANSYSIEVNRNESIYCEVKDSVGDCERLRFNITPSFGLEVYSDMPTNCTVTKGEDKTLTMTADADDPNVSFSYIWKVLGYNENEEHYEYYPVDGATSNSFTLSNVTKDTYVIGEVTASYNGFEEKKQIMFKVCPREYHLNVTSNIYTKYAYGYAKVNKPVKFTVTDSVGTVFGNLTDEDSNEHELTLSGNDFIYTPTKMGSSYFSAGIQEEHSWNARRFVFTIRSFVEKESINVGESKVISASLPPYYYGYSFIPTQTGQYYIYLNKHYEVFLIDEDGKNKYIEMNGLSDDGTETNDLVNLEANKKYYFVVDSEQYSWVNSSDNNTANFRIISNISCSHDNSRLDNAVTPTCTSKGYSGDVYCLDCNKYISEGTELPIAEHIPTIINTKAATCTEKGYTGDTVCAICNANISTGTEIPAYGHNSTVVNAKVATISEDGHTGQTVCTTCGETISQGNVIAKIKSISLSKDMYTYTGRNIKAAVVVKDSKGKKIDDSYYKLTYSKDIKTVGVKTVKITFNGNYKGVKTLKYKIVPKNTSKLSLKVGKNSINVNWNKQVKQTTGYQIQYSTKQNFKSAKTIKIKNNKTVKTTIKSLKKGTTYYVRIRTYKTVNKKAITSNWSKAKKIKVTK